MFENLEVAVDALPSADEVEWQPLHHRYVPELQLKRALTLLGLGIGASLLSLIPTVDFTPVAILPALLLLAVPLLAWPVIAVPRRGFAIRERDIVYRAGVLWQSVTAVPYNRVQHVETGSTPFDRRFGTATLVLFTAGGSGGDLRIDGLEAGIAERLRVHILDKAGAGIETG